MSIEEEQKIYNEKYKILGPSQSITKEEYISKGYEHGLQCEVCDMFVDQDYTVWPGICLSCYFKGKV